MEDKIKSKFINHAKNYQCRPELFASNLSRKVLKTEKKILQDRNNYELTKKRMLADL
ncbi:MAG: hypothetical protein WEB87_05445 [Bacteriovoracaceae bacterium]